MSALHDKIAGMLPDYWYVLLSMPPRLTPEEQELCDAMERRIEARFKAGASGHPEEPLIVEKAVWEAKAK